MGSRYEDDRFTTLVQFAPVETENGEAGRQAALAILRPRYEALDTRSRTEYSFSEIEGQHMRALEQTLAQLDGMAPVAALIRSRDPERLRPVLT